MRKNDLIKMLNEIKGNPEVVLWNSSVGDWMHIDKPQLHTFSRYKKSFKIKAINSERFRDRLPDLNEEEIKNVENDEFEIGEGNRFGILKDENFEHRSRIVIKSKSRGIKTFDRLGKIRY